LDPYLVVSRLRVVSCRLCARPIRLRELSRRGASTFFISSELLTTFLFQANRNGLDRHYALPRCGADQAWVCDGAVLWARAGDSGCGFWGGGCLCFAFRFSSLRGEAEGARTKGPSIPVFARAPFVSLAPSASPSPAPLPPSFLFLPSSLTPRANPRLQELSGPAEGVLALKTPWPSIARTIWQDHARYLETYMKPYPGLFYTGDGAARDEEGYIWIKGRVDGEFCFLSWPIPPLSLQQAR
jgi:acyl-CoA synthetase (AMP-forming)/AMP-acid ligase II